MADITIMADDVPRAIELGKRLEVVECRRINDSSGFEYFGLQRKAWLSFADALWSVRGQSASLDAFYQGILAQLGIVNTKALDADA